MYLTQLLCGKLKFYNVVLKSVARVEFAYKAADEIRMTMFQTLLSNDNNRACNNKLTNNFAGSNDQKSRVGCGPRAVSFVTQVQLNSYIPPISLLKK